MMWPTSSSDETVTLGREDVLSVGVRDELRTRAVVAIENGAVKAYNWYDRACAVRVLGTDPPAVSRVIEARTVFVWAVCTSVGTGTESGSSGPVALHLTDPPTAETPEDGAYWWPSLKRIFPERLWRVRPSPNDYEELGAQVRQRVASRGR